MFDKFAEYMQYLMPSPLKKQKKTNQLLIYCRMIGGMYDDLLQSLLRLREETILDTCSHEILEVFGNDYDMPQIQGETNEMYRRRLQMKALIAESAGTQRGILYALASMGYDKCTITPFYLTDPERWAEIRIDIFTPSVDVDNPISFRCIVAEIMKVKKASTLPHWRFYYPIQIWHTGINSIRVAVRFILFIQFWNCCIYNGQNCYDGTLQYNSKRDYKTVTRLRNRMQIHTAQHLRCADISARMQVKNNSSITSAMQNCYSISFWDCALYNGVWRYDGVLLYDAVRRYGLRLITAARMRVQTIQAISCEQCRLRTWLINKESIKARIRSDTYTVKEPVLQNKCRVRIHMEVFFPAEKIGNVSLETSRHVAYYDGTLRYDGTAKYDALYRKEEIE